MILQTDRAVRASPMNVDDVAALLGQTFTAEQAMAIGAPLEPSVIIAVSYTHLTLPTTPYV